MTNSSLLDTSLRRSHEEVQEAMRKHRQDKLDFIQEYYGDTNRVQKMFDAFHFQFNPVSFLDQYEDLLFDIENPFFRLDPASFQRKLTFNETDFHLIYDIDDVSEETLGLPHNTLVVYAKKDTSLQNPSLLSRFGFDSVVDFEIFESPSLLNEAYQFPQNELAKKIHGLVNVKTGEIRHAVRKNVAGLYVEMEKIHLRLARKDGHFFPIYVGVGANEPLGLKIQGKMGAQRFLKYSFEEAGSNTGIVRGVINRKPVANIGSIDTRIVHVEYLTDATPVYCVRTDDCISYYLDENTQLLPEYEYDFISKQEYYADLLRQQDPLSTLVKNVSDAIVPYQDFAKLAYDPTFLIQTSGFDVAMRSRERIRAIEQVSRVKSHLAHDLYERDFDDRLKLGSVLLNRLHRTGKLEKLLHDTADGKTYLS